MAAAGGRPSAPGSSSGALAASAGALSRCRCRPNQPMLMAPAEARMEAISTFQARRRVEDQSKRRSSKHVLKPEASNSAQI